jgi:O-antigen biosynthesis protein
MNWPWRNANQTTPQAPASPQPAATPTIPLDALIAQADSARDARHWADAAATYQAVLQRAPSRTPIWVQLGHALKESGDFPAAEAAYRQALTLAPDTADTHLQLGHVLKLQGRRPAAVAAYATALKADRGCTPALTELIALGESWRAEQATDLGQPMLAALLQTAGDLRAALTRLERALPDATSLASVPPALFQSRYRLPPPPATEASLRWAVLVLDRYTPDAVIACLRGLAEQERPPVSVTVISENPETPAEMRRFVNGGLLCPVQVVPPDAPFVPAECDWLLVCTSGTVLVPGASAWLDWAAEQTTAAAFYMDEHSSVPVLKAAHDPEADTALFRHTILACRGTPPALHAPDPLQAMADAAAADGGIAHLARILARRTVEPPPPAHRPRLPQQPDDTTRLGLIIPTRNGGATLRDCLDALRATAAEPSRLDIVILDNGSDDPATLSLLAEVQSLGVAKVVRDDAPFNWSRLNNAGVAACQSPILVFLNDDVAITASGWDQTLRRLLVRPEIGAAGGRLDYPDGGLQHGGIVFGPGGRTEHEGVAAAGVLADIAARWVTRRRVGAVTGAFLACRRTDFTAAGGFDAAHFPIWFNDIDFCLKLRAAGLTILYDPAIRATHHESRTLSAQPHDATRQATWDDSLRQLQQRWGDALHIDPGFNPHFARTGRPFELLMEPSTAAIQAHLLRSAQPNPWRISPPDR